MEFVTNAVNWVEIPVANFERAKKFYSAIFDYEMPEMMMDNTRMGFLLHDQEKGIGGAIVFGEGCVPSKDGSKVYLNGGTDLNLVLNRIETAGGKIIISKTPINPEYGYYAIFEDTEGNHIGLHSM